MKNRFLRHIICAVLGLAVAVVLCGCDMFTTDTDTLLTPPEPTGDLYPIQQALKASIKGDYTLKYPSSGDRRSAVILEDLNGDNSFEAFAFYSTVEEDVTYMNVNLIVSQNGEWRSVGRQSVVAGGVERVDFCDLDGDGTEELLVGWEIYTSTEKELAVYSCSLDGLSQRMLQQYTSYLCCDLDENGEYEVFIQTLDTANGVNAASLFEIGDSGVSQVAGSLMDRNVKSADWPRLSELSSGQPAIYIDEIKGAGAVTEVLLFSKDTLLNPLLDATAENTKTLRSSSILSRDINLDGVIEIPIASELTAASPLDNGEKFYYTGWYSFNGEVLTQKLTTVMNLTDGYYISVPSKWVDKIAVSRDTENRSRTFYAYDAESGAVGERIAYFQVIDLKEWKNDNYNKSLYVEVCRTDNQVIIASNCAANGPLAVTTEELKSMLNLID